MTTSELDPWQGPDGFPTDAYFTAVIDALNAAGVAVNDFSREEAWEFNLEIHPRAYKDGPLGWAKHGLWVSWRVDEECADSDRLPRHADDFTGLGWYWVPYTKPQACGDFAKEFDHLPYLAEPDQVAAAVADLVKNGG